MSSVHRKQSPPSARGTRINQAERNAGPVECVLLIPFNVFYQGLSEHFININSPCTLGKVTDNTQVIEPASGGAGLGMEVGWWVKRGWGEARGLAGEEKV